MRTSVLLLAAWLATSLTVAGEPCKAPPTCTEVQTCGGPNSCARCGCSNACCQRQCKIVCEMKDVKKTVWAVKCSEVCTVMPRCGHDCNCQCGACSAVKPCEESCSCANGKCDPCAAEKNKHYVPPKCGRVHEVKKLEKKEVICKVPVYKCVVEYCCSNCGGSDAATPAAPMPPAKQPVSPPPAPAPVKTTQAAMPSLGLIAAE